MSFFQVIDPVFGSYVMGNAPVKKLAAGFGWVEGRCGLAMRAVCCFPTFQTTGFCAGPQIAASAPIAPRRTTPMAIPAICRGGLCPANMGCGVSPAPNMMGGSR